jgi:maleylacetoacetate isomerase
MISVMIQTHYSYFRSSTDYRVRIAMALKGVEPAERKYVNLREGGQMRAEFSDVNPSQGVPVIVLEDGRAISQSMAILEWLEENYPKPALLPKDSGARAQVRAFAQAIACDVHPLINLRVQKYISEKYGENEEGVTIWYRYWIQRGFGALETTLLQRKYQTPFCFGNEPTLADVCLVPQVYGAERFKADLSAYPILMDIVTQCRRHPAFIVAAPQNQPDCPLELR